MLTQAAISKAEVGASPKPAQRTTQKRWPMAFSILGAVSVSILLWVGIGWIVLQVMAFFN